MARPRQKKRIKKPPILFGRSQKLIHRLERQLGTAFLTYWMSPSGSVCDSDVIALYEHCRRLKGQPVALFIKSHGGSGQASLRIINLLRQHANRLNALVPLECASAATMIALGADSIRMGPLAFLTAIDTSLRHELSPTDVDNELVSVSQDELMRVVRLWGARSKRSDTNPFQALFPHVHPLVIGAADRASSLSIRLCREILSYHTKSTATAEQISRHLNSDYPSHSYPITLREARRIGLKVQPLDLGINDLLLELNEVYSEMGQKALTDYDEHNYHNNEVANIVESRGLMVFFQIDKDWHYRKEERRWDPMNDQSSWRRVEQSGRRVIQSVFHIR
ncbi:hypothetical protein ACFL5O_09735 [Myxococcota bacterium]